MAHRQQVKMIGSNGQLSLGKDFAGKMVLVDQIDQGTWIIRSGEFIPDSEKWLHEEGHIAKLEKAIQWAKKTKPVDNFEKLARGIENDKNKN
jgi:hypothetical protein